MLTADTLKLLNETAATAAGVASQFQIVRPAGLPADQFLIAKRKWTYADGITTESVETDLQTITTPRNSALYSVASIPDAVAGINRDTTNDPETQFLWIDRHGINFEIDHRAAISLRFRRSAEAKRVRMLREGKRLPPKELRKFLRHLGRDTWGANCAALFDAASSVKFEQTTRTRAAAAAGRESMGRDLDAAVALEEGARIPETITLHIRLIDDPAVVDRFPVELTVDVDFDNGAFELCLLGDAFTDATDRLVGAIVERLRPQLPTSLPILFGRPKAQEAAQGDDE